MKYTSYRVFQNKVPTFVFSISRLQKHLNMWLCTIFNRPAFAELKNDNILILGLIGNVIDKNEVRIPYLKWRVLRFQPIWCTIPFFQFLGIQDTLKSGFVQFSTSQIVLIQKLKYHYYRIEIGEWINESVIKWHKVSLL